MISTYATMVNQKILIPSQRTNYVAVQRDHLVVFLSPHVAKIYFDEDWYISQYPDIADAVEEGIIPSAHDHYIKSGYYEGRMPYEIKVDEGWYLAQYADIRDAVADGKFTSGQDHFQQAGIREGRLPYPGFALRMDE